MYTYKLYWYPEGCWSTNPQRRAWAEWLVKHDVEVRNTVVAGARKVIIKCVLVIVGVGRRGGAFGCSPVSQRGPSLVQRTEPVGGTASHDRYVRQGGQEEQKFQVQDGLCCVLRR